MLRIFQQLQGVQQIENLSMLSPMLFSITVNDLENYLNKNDWQHNLNDAHNTLKITVLLYADGTIVLPDSVKSLQKH